MPDRIHTSSAAEEVLNSLRINIHLEYALLGRIALAWSLNKAGAKVPPSEDFTGKEIRWVSFNTRYLSRKLAAFQGELGHFDLDRSGVLAAGALRNSNTSNLQKHAGVARA